MFTFTSSVPPTGKHHLHSHPNPVTVAELEARERAENIFDLACESCSAYLTADEIANNADMPNQVCDECLEAFDKGEI